MNILEETLRYLGWHGQPVSDEVLKQAGQAVKEVQGAATMRHVTREFTAAGQPGGILLGEGALLLTGNHISSHLAGCSRVWLMAFTLGAGVDRLIARYSSSDIPYGVMLDAAASALIEAYCDQVEAELTAKESQHASITFTTRFSPGYGDLPLNLQPRILDLLDAQRRAGLTCTGTDILIPRKSVTAVIGATQTAAPGPAVSCSNCRMRGNCSIPCRNRGIGATPREG